MPGLSAPEYAIAAVVVAAGALVQGSIGFGFALVSAPVLAIVEPGAVPVVPLVLALPVNLVVLARDRHAIDARGAAEVTAGMVVGTVAAVPILVAVPDRFLAVLFGAATLVGAIASVPHPQGEFGAAARAAAGAGSGLINTVASTGGPLVALVYQRCAGPVLRATLAVTFTAAVFLSLAAQGVAGRLAWWQLSLSAVLLPALTLGLWASRYGARALDRRWARAAVLAVAGASGVAAIAKGLV